MSWNLRGFKEPTVNRQSERGISLILTMVLLVIMSVMAISLTFISRTETWSTMNYRMMSQARDAAETGVNATANYLMGSTFTTLPTTYYTPPGTVSDPLTAYNISAYPVQNGATSTTGQDVVLSASSASSNYPVSSVQSTFNTSGVGKGSFAAGNTTVNYATSAKLLQMQQLNPSIYNPSATTLQTWEITSQGSIAGVPSAAEQVTAVLERPAVPAFGYAAFATNAGCNALRFGGGGSTDSYNSAVAVASGSSPTTSPTDGNVGTNGNLDTNGNTTVINGNLSTPRSGVGTCSTSNVTAWTDTTTNQLNGSIVQLPQTVVLPTPPAPNPMPGTTNHTFNNGTCAGNGVAANCSQTADGYAFSGGAINSSGTCGSPSNPPAPTTFDNITINGNTNLHLTAGCYNFNSVSLSGGAQIVIDSGPVIINIAGQGISGNSNVLDLTGGGLVNNAGWDPSMFQVLYAGSASIALKGGANAVGTIYAPNASYGFNSSGGSWYGSVVGSTLKDMGGASIHYDRRLKDKFYVPGNFMLSSFTWNKY
jgi:Tfp pilus assembly protein PilX